MLTNWIRRIGSARLLALAIVSLFMGSMAIDTAEARFGRSRGGGGFSSFGNRGSRSSGIGAGGMQALPNRANPANNGLRNNNPAQAANRGSWMQRNPLMAGLMGAIAGTMIGSMLMNAFGGMGGMGGILMLILGAVALFAVFRMFMARKQAPAASGIGMGRSNTYDAHNMNGQTMNAQGRSPYSGIDAPPASPTSYANQTAYADENDASTAYSQTREQGLAAIALEDPTMNREKLQDVLSGRFFQIQEAWSSADRNTLMAATTKSMYDEFSGDLDAMQKRNEQNIIKNIVIRSFEITEAWQEGEWEFVTANINARLLDYTQRGAQIIDGDAVNPTHFIEYWTFVRPRGKGEWKLSAVNQEA